MNSITQSTVIPFDLGSVPMTQPKSTLPRPELFAVCLVLASALQIMENLLPRIPLFPWVKLGLSHWILLPFLLRYGVMPVMILFFSRNISAVLFGGQLFTSFLISSISGLGMFLIAGGVVRWMVYKKWIGLLGASILLAAGFNLFQMMIANLWLIRHSGFLFQTGPILIWSIISGACIGFLVYKSMPLLEKMFLKHETSPDKPAESNHSMTHRHRALGWKFWTYSGLLILILFWPEFWGQLVLLPILMGFSKKQDYRAFKFAWAFFVFLAWFHLTQTGGLFLWGQWVTREGLDKFFLHSLRTFNFLLAGQQLARSLPALHLSSKNRYFQGAALAISIFPSLFGMSIGMGKKMFKMAKQGQWSLLLDPVIEKVEDEIELIRQTR